MNLYRVFIYFLIIFYSAEMQCFEPDWSYVFDNPNYGVKSFSSVFEYLPQTHNPETLYPEFQKTIPANYERVYGKPMEFGILTQDLRVTDPQGYLPSAYEFYDNSGFEIIQPEPVSLLDALNSYHERFPYMTEEKSKYSSQQYFSDAIPPSKRMKTHEFIPPDPQQSSPSGFTKACTDHHPLAFSPSVTEDYSDYQVKKTLSSNRESKKRKREMDPSELRPLNERDLELIATLQEILYTMWDSIDSKVAAHKLYEMEFKNREYSAVSSALRKILNKPEHSEYIDTVCLRNVVNAANRIYERQKLERKELTDTQKELLDSIKSLPIRQNPSDKDYENAAKKLFLSYKTGKTFSGLRYALNHIPERLIDSEELKEKVRHLKSAAGRLYEIRRKQNKMS